MTKVKSQFSDAFLKKAEALLVAEKAKLEKELEKFSDKKGGEIFPDYGSQEDENAAEVADYVVKKT